MFVTRRSERSAACADAALPDEVSCRPRTDVTSLALASAQSLTHRATRYTARWPTLSGLLAAHRREDRARCGDSAWASMLCWCWPTCVTAPITGWRPASGAAWQPCIGYVREAVDLIPAWRGRRS